MLAQRTTLLFLAVIASSTALALNIDIHIHAIPPAYADAIANAGGDPSGFGTPMWTPQTALKSMDLVGTEKSYLSISSPGVPIAGKGKGARLLCRTLNLSLANYSSDPTYNGRFGFWGALPDFQDVQGTLDELDFLFNSQKKAIGVIIYSLYGDKLPGDASFAPIWQRLEQYKALIFLHPGIMKITPFFINGLPQPILDYPQATTRAATDLVITGTFSSAPSVDIVLAHAGGTIPYLGQRIIGSLVIPQAAASSNVTAAEALVQFQRFYYDTALSTSAAQLNGLLDFAGPSKVLFGSDSPYAPDGAIGFENGAYLSFVATDPRGAQFRPAVLRANAETLLRKHKGFAQEAQD